MKWKLVDLAHLFNGMSTIYGVLNVESWFTCKWSLYESNFVVKWWRNSLRNKRVRIPVKLVFTFGLIFLGMVLTPLSFQLWVKRYHYCSSTWIDLALNNPQRLICHKTKTPNEMIYCNLPLHFLKNELYLSKIFWLIINVNKSCNIGY